MGTAKHKINQKGSTKALFCVLGIPLIFVLLSSGIFHSLESRMVLLPEELSPGSPVSVILAIPETAHAQEVKTMFPKAGELVPLCANLISTSNRVIQTAPLFYFDRIETDGKKYTLTMAMLVVPNTYEDKEAFIEIQRDKTPPTESDTFMTIRLPGRQSLPISPRSFNTETIAFGPENTDIKTKPDPQKTAEARELWKIITTSSPGLYTLGGFAAPVASDRRTSFFGDRRIYQYTTGASERSIHGGIDFGVPRGTMVQATAPGLVRMARFRIVTGNTVILQHAPGVYSLYYHMDSLSVTEGSQIDEGTELGRSGSTGLSTGPHLHWEFRIHGEYADPDLMVSIAPLDKGRILSKIMENLSN